MKLIYILIIVSGVKYIAIFNRYNKVIIVSQWTDLKDSFVRPVVPKDPIKWQSMDKFGKF